MKLELEQKLQFWFSHIVKQLHSAYFWFSHPSTIVHLRESREIVSH